MAEWFSLVSFTAAWAAASDPERNDRSVGIILATANILIGVWLIAGAPGIL